MYGQLAVLGVMMILRPINNWQGVNLQWVYVHFSIGELIECNGVA